MHWKNCSRGDCPVCLPLKNSCDSRSGAASSANTQTTGFAMHQSFQQQQQQQQPRMVHPDLARAYAALGLPPPGQQPAPSNVLGQKPLALSSALSLPAPGVGANHLGIPMSTTASLWPDIGAQQQQHRPTMTQQILDLTGNLELNKPGLLSGNAFAGDAPNRPVKDWHQSVTQDLRQHLVHKL